MAAGLFPAFIDDYDCSPAARIDQAEQLSGVDGVSSVRTYRPASAQVPLPGSLAVEHTGLIACVLGNVSSSSDAVVQACWSSLRVPT